METPNKKLKVPHDELLFILPEPRRKLFMDMISEYKTRFSEFKLIYAYLNNNGEIPIDYLVIFEAIGEKSKCPIILYDIPYIYTDRAIPGYRYAKRENRLDDFFSDADNFMTRISKNRFYEYVNDIMNLSTDHNKKEYWGNADNALAVAKNLADLSLYYTKKNN